MQSDGLVQCRTRNKDLCILCDYGMDQKTCYIPVVCERKKAALSGCIFVHALNVL